jgi:signal transduction histidine kinase
MGEGLIKVNVDDNGKGFDPDTLEKGGSLGLNLIRERAEMLGGNFELDSVVGKGTRVSFSLPVKG